MGWIHAKGKWGHVYVCTHTHSHACSGSNLEALLAFWKLRDGRRNRRKGLESVQRRKQEEAILFYRAGDPPIPRYIL